MVTMTDTTLTPEDIYFLEKEFEEELMEAFF
jgi:hypothetical protein